MLLWGLDLELEGEKEGLSIDPASPAVLIPLTGWNYLERWRCLLSFVEE